MLPKRKILIGGFALLLSFLAHPAEALGLKATVRLPDVQGRFDHFNIDTSTHRLFVAALGNNTVEIIDTVKGQRIQTISGQHKPAGIAFIPGTRRLFVANGGDGTVKVYEGAMDKLVNTIGGLDDADNIRYDDRAHRLYVGYGEGSLAIIDPDKLETIGRIKLKAHPESFQLERNSPRIFVNVPGARHIALVNRDARAVVGTWPMERLQANFPMALDESNHRLFIGCRQPARLAVVDTTTGQITADFGISGDTDDLFWDATRKRLYISCGEGFIDVFAAVNGQPFTLSQRIKTSDGARTSFFSPANDEFYLAVPARTAAAELRIYAVP